MSRLQLLAKALEPTCPDCPATRQGVFASLARGKNACAFHCSSLNSRDPLPRRWSESFEIGLVRRGVIIRQRVDSYGRVTAVDAVGPGCVFPLGGPSGNGDSTGYAASDAMVCLCSSDILEAAIGLPDGTARDMIQLQREAIDRMERLADARGRATAEARVAALLVALADTLAPRRTRDHIPSGIQQRDMAELVGLRHETVCRALRALEQRGAIDREGDELRIVDRSGLEAA